MNIDIKKIKLVEAQPPVLTRSGPGIISPLTKIMIDMEPGQAFGIPTGGGREHKIQQRNVNARGKGVVKMHKDRVYVTRTLSPGDKLGNITLKEITLGIYRTK